MSVKVTIRDAASVPRVRSVPNPKGPSRRSSYEPLPGPVSTADVRVANHGSIVLFHPQTDAALKWIAQHIPTDATRWGPALVVEPQYVDDIVEGMQNDGLEVQ